MHLTRLVIERWLGRMTELATSTPPWLHAELGDQPGRDERLAAGDLQQREKVLTHARLDVDSELVFLNHEQRDLLGNLAHCLFTDPIQLTGPRCGVRSRGLDSNSTPQQTDDLFVFG